MILVLKRIAFLDDCTIGTLSIDGQVLCHTLEDRSREIEGRPVNDWKVPGSTAIPRGSYAVLCDYSERFKRVLPRLLDVPGFAGVRIHAGNTAKDTEGCILVGLEWSEGPQIRRSLDALTALFGKIRDTKDLKIEIS